MGVGCPARGADRVVRPHILMGTRELGADGALMQRQIFIEPQKPGAAEPVAANDWLRPASEQLKPSDRLCLDSQGGHDSGSEDCGGMFDFTTRTTQQKLKTKIANGNEAIVAKYEKERRKLTKPASGGTRDDGGVGYGEMRPSNGSPGDQGAGDRKRSTQPGSITSATHDSRLKVRLHAQTGPTSEAGKRAVSQNAVKHGFYARASEGDQMYAACEQAVRGCLEPVGEIQTRVSESIAFELWRIAKIEQTVRTLDKGIDEERVNLSHLADQLEFPFSRAYTPLLILYRDEEQLRLRVRGHCEGVFTELLMRPFLSQGAYPQGQFVSILGPMSEQSNDRAKVLLERSTQVLNRQFLIQQNEDEFFQEFDAVMLDTRLGKNKIGVALLDAGDLMPLVECWVYRNHSLIQIVIGRMLGSLRLELMTDPKVERALKTARSRLNSLLHDYLLEAPDKLGRARALGFF